MYKCIHQVRNYGKGGGVSIYIHNSLNFKPRPDLSIYSFDVESLSIELLCKKKKNKCTVQATKRTARTAS